MRTREDFIKELSTHGCSYENLVTNTIQLKGSPMDYKELLKFFQLEVDMQNLGSIDKPDWISVLPMEVTTQLKNGTKHVFYPTDITSGMTIPKIKKLKLYDVLNIHSKKGGPPGK